MSIALTPSEPDAPCEDKKGERPGVYSREVGLTGDIYSDIVAPRGNATETGPVTHGPAVPAAGEPVQASNLPGKTSSDVPT